LAGKIAIVVSCTKCKRHVPPARLKFHTLAKGPIDVVAEQWLQCLGDFPAYRPDELYCGPGWSHIMQAVQAGNTGLGAVSLFVLSAGFGWLRSTDSIPAYSASFADGEDQVCRKISATDSVTGIHRLWWRVINRKRGYAGNPLSILDEYDHVLLATGADYISAISDELEEIVPRLGREKLWIVSIGTHSSGIGQVLSSYLLPCDIHIEHVLPGTRSTVNQRVLSWLLREVIPQYGWSIDAVSERLHSAVVDGRRIKAQQPAREIKRLSDSDVKDWIREGLNMDHPMTKSELLAQFRKTGSCEQARFYRLVTDVKSALECR